MRSRLLLALCLLIIFPAVLRAQQAGYYIPYHIYDTQTKQWIDLESLLATVSTNDVLFIGEQHNDSFGHQLELAIVEGAARRRNNVIIAMEMFERDAQPALNDYLAGRINELEFVSRARPWPNYQQDYRPIIQFALARKLPVIGSNAPGRLARTVASNGIGVVERFPSFERSLVAQQLECPHDSYWQRFMQTMTGMMGHGGGEGSENPHSNPHGASTPAVNGIGERIERFYQAQCLKDETMGESIAKVLQTSASTKPLIIHINGDFHSAFREGTEARARRRLPEARIKNISIVPVDNLDKINTEEFQGQADYLIFTLQQADNN